MAALGPWTSLARLPVAPLNGALRGRAILPGTVVEAGVAVDDRSQQGTALLLVAEIMDEGAHGLELKVVPMAFSEQAYQE